MILIFRKFHFFQEPKEERLPRSTHAPSPSIYQCLLLISKYCNIHRIYSKYFVNHRGFQPLGQHIKVQKALNKYSTYLL